MSSSVVRPTRFICYAWGDEYLEKLLSITLPAMLSPGNLPYVAATLPCDVVLLIQERSHWTVRNHPSIECIRRLCPVRLLGLDDLITAKDKYGVSLTYALHRGFIDLGSAATDSYLLFLNADFVVADGSFRKVVNHLMAGERLVAAPSYCVVSREVAPELCKRIDAISGALSLTPREMARLALRNLHDTVRGKILNQNKFHLLQMDQFYWQLDMDTLLGSQMPVAIVGMRPECFVAEPNSYWDYGLMREFCPTAPPCVIGDSDDFLMVELREKEVAQDQIVVGPLDPREAGERMIGWVTPYQREFKKHPLTLHTQDLLPSAIVGHTKLAACVEEILSHSPRVLPSHLDHPQWKYHWGPFMEARHKYLSSQLGSTTESEQEPQLLFAIDRIWWRLRGLKKRHERMRAELEGARDAHLKSLQEEMTQISSNAEAQRMQINKRFLEEFRGIDAAPEPDAYFFRRKLDARTGADRPKVSEKSVEHEVLQKYRQEFGIVQKGLNDKMALLTRALHAIYRDYEQELQLLDENAKADRLVLENDYKRLMPKRANSAAIPQVRIVQGGDTRSQPGKSRPGQLKTTLAAVWHKTLLRIYRAPLRHLGEVIASVAAKGGRNVLVVGSGPSIVRAAVVRFPGVRAFVTSTEAQTGNLRWTFDRQLRFDLCVWDLDATELSEFPALLNVVKPCMSAGGTVVGFHWNVNRAAIPVDGVRSENSKFARISVANVSRFINAVEQCRKAVTNGRFLSATKSPLRYLAKVPRRIAQRPKRARLSREQSLREAMYSTVTIEARLTPDDDERLERDTASTCTEG